MASIANPTMPDACNQQPPFISSILRSFTVHYHQTSVRKRCSPDTCRCSKDTLKPLNRPISIMPFRRALSHWVTVARRWHAASVFPAPTREAQNHLLLFGGLSSPNATPSGRGVPYMGPIFSSFPMVHYEATRILHQRPMTHLSFRSPHYSSFLLSLVLQPMPHETGKELHHPIMTNDS
jgi:hypothetical protein